MRYRSNYWMPSLAKSCKHNRRMKPSCRRLPARGVALRLAINCIGRGLALLIVLPATSATRAAPGRSRGQWVHPGRRAATVTLPMMPSPPGATRVESPVRGCATPGTARSVQRAACPMICWPHISALDVEFLSVSAGSGWVDLPSLASGCRLWLASVVAARCSTVRSVTDTIVQPQRIQRRWPDRQADLSPDLGTRVQSGRGLLGQRQLGLLTLAA